MKNLSVIRRIEDVSDFDRIMLIETQAFVEPYTKDLYLYDFLNHPYSEYYKLVLNEEIIGFFGLWIIFEDAQITTLAVDPSYQGLGYGNVIMDFIISYIREKGCQNITLEVRISNIQAIHLYEKYHFEAIALRKHYYENGEDAYLMKCDIK